MLPRRAVVLALAIVLTALPVVSAPTAAFGYGGVAHEWAGQQAVDLMEILDPLQITEQSSPLSASRSAAGAHIFPELGVGSMQGAAGYGSFVEAGSYQADNFDTRHHFWEADDGLHELPEGVAGLDNAWETASDWWNEALFYYWAGDKLNAFLHLGYVVHIVGDGGQPAHTNCDLHPTEDSLEEWFVNDRPSRLYAFTDGSKPSPGPIVKPPSNAAVIAKSPLRPAGARPDRVLRGPAPEGGQQPHEPAPAVLHHVCGEPDGKLLRLRRRGREPHRADRVAQQLRRIPGEFARFVWQSRLSAERERAG